MKNRLILLGIVLILLSSFAVAYSLCYQETATVSTACGGLSNGSYAHVGDWSSTTGAYNGNWDTGDWFSIIGIPHSGYIYFNYSKPLHALRENSSWKVRGSQPPYYLLEIPVGCWNLEPLQLRFYGYWNNDASTIRRWACYDGSWQTLRSELQDNFRACWEEAMWWYKNQTFFNTNLINLYNDSLINNYEVNITTPETEALNDLGLYEGLVSMWGFGFEDEYNDYYGDNDGTCTNCPIWNTSCEPFNEAYTFNGIDDIIDITGTYSTWDSSKPITFSAWINNFDNNQFDTIVNFKVDEGSRFAIQNKEGIFTAGVYDGSSWVDRSSGTSVINQMVHISATFDGSNIILYINGVPQTSGVSPLTSSTSGFKIGGRTDLNVGTFFNGTIAKPMIWNRALSETEVQLLYGYTQPVTDGLISSYRFNNNIEDSWGNPYIPTEAGTISYATGIENYAYDNDGSINYIDFTSDPYENDSNSSRSYSFWVKPNMDGWAQYNSQPILGTDCFYFHIREVHNSMIMRFDNSGSYVSFYNLGANYRDWIQVIGTYDGSTNTTKIYINGTLRDIDIHPKKPLCSYLISDWSIGKKGGAVFNGSIDSVLTYNKVLDDTEAMNLFLYEKEIYLKERDLYRINYTTTNGEVTTKYPSNTIVNVSFYNIEGNTYYNQTEFNWNTSTNLAMYTYQSILYIYAQDADLQEDIENFNFTVGAQYNTSQSYYTKFYLNAVNLYYSGNAEDFPDNVTGYFTPSILTIHNITMNFTKNRINTLYFYDIKTSNPIENATVTVDYPTGYQTILTTNSSGAVDFSYVINYDAVYGNYSITFEEQGFTAITFTEEITETNAPINESYNMTRATIIINIYDRETLNLLTGINVDIILLDYLNATTNNGTYTIQNITITAGELTLQAIADGYITEQTIVTYTSQENATVNFYLLNATGSNTAFLYTSTIDEFYRTLEGATVSLFAYDIGSSAYIKVSELLSNVNGEGIFSIEMNVKTYYITASKVINGILYSAETNPEIIQTADEVRNLILRLSDPFDVSVTDYLIIEYSETYENNISTIYVEYSTHDGFVAEVCVGYFNISNNSSLVSEQCVNSSDAYMAIPTLIDRENNYQGRIYQKYNTEIFLIMSYTYPAISSFDSILQINEYSSPIFIWLWMALLVISLLMKNMLLFSIGGIILTWVQFFNSPSTAIGSASVLKTLILIFMTNSSRRREDLN